ncbi:MAG: hypothetical protein ACM3SM_10405 [Bacteroidota bacterium]
MNRIFYFMHISWFWVKQRPQYLCEELSRYYDIEVFHLNPLHKSKKLVNNGDKLPSKINSIYLLPLNKRSKMISWLNKKLSAIYFSYILPGRGYNIYWITHPILLEFIDVKLFTNGLIVYDCMDDALTEPSVVKSGKSIRLRNLERILVEKSSLVFCSSDNLKAKILTRYGVNDKCFVCNNGLALNAMNNPDHSAAEYLMSLFGSGRGYKIISYVGVISKWMDLRLLIESLNKYNDIIYYLWGPVECEIPKHERLKCMGTIPKNQVQLVLNNSDMLVMPFVLSDFIESVNPVKIYEYIYSGTPSVVINYGEMENFSDFLFLYKNDSEYFGYIEMLLSGKLKMKKGKTETMEYLKYCTWENRASSISQVIDTKINEKVLSDAKI